MTILERMARVRDCIQADRAAVGHMAVEIKPTKQWESFGKWNDSPVFSKQPEEGKGEVKAWQ